MIPPWPRPYRQPRLNCAAVSVACAVVLAWVLVIWKLTL